MKHKVLKKYEFFFTKIELLHLEANDLYNIVERSNTNNQFNAGIGKLFVLVDERNEKEFNDTLCMLREQQIGPLSAVSMEAGGGSYQRGYEYVVNLHALQEIESCLSQLLSLRNDTTDKEHYRNSLIKNLDSYLIVPWEHRVQTMQPSFKVCQFILWSNQTLFKNNNLFYFFNLQASRTNLQRPYCSAKFSLHPLGHKCL